MKKIFSFILAFSMFFFIGIAELSPISCFAQDGSIYTTMEKGSKGDTVKLLQLRLIELHYLPDESADGKYGDKTKTAIERFQSFANLPVTGIADEYTQEILFSDNAPDVVSMAKAQYSLCRDKGFTEYFRLDDPQKILFGDNSEFGKSMFKGRLLAQGATPETVEKMIYAICHYQPITDFEFPVYSDYEGENAEDHIGDRIRIFGVVRDYYKVESKGDIDYVLGFKLIDAEGHDWFIACGYYLDGNMLGGSPFEDKEYNIFNGYEGSTVEIYGECVGYSKDMNMPCVNITKYGAMFLEKEKTLLITDIAEDKFYSMLEKCTGSEQVVKSVETFWVRYTR